MLFKYGNQQGKNFKTNVLLLIGTLLANGLITYFMLSYVKQSYIPDSYPYKRGHCTEYSLDLPT